MVCHRINQIMKQAVLIIRNCPNPNLFPASVRSLRLALSNNLKIIPNNKSNLTTSVKELRNG